MTTPTILPNRSSRYLDVRQLMRAAVIPDAAPTPPPATVPFPTRAELIMRVMRAATEPLTAQQISERSGLGHVSVCNWLRDPGHRHGVVCVGTVLVKVGCKQSNLWAIKRGAA